MTEIRFKRAEEDDFKAADPDSLMRSVSNARLGRTLGLSLAGHVVVILLLSLGNLALCVKHKTPNLLRAIELRKDALKKEVERRKAEAAEKRKQELLRKAKEGAAKKAETEQAGAKQAEPAPGAGEEGQRVPKVIRDITETSDERPTSSGLESIDDLLEE